MANIDKISVKNTVYNIVSPAVVSDYIEVIGGACTKPDGYVEDEVILAKQNDVQLLFKATQDIAFGANIVENTNCVRTTLEEVLKNAGGGGGASSADQVSYDNSDSGLEAENVQEAVDELATNAGTASSQIQTLTSKVANEIATRAKVGAHNFVSMKLSPYKAQANNYVSIGTQTDSLLTFTTENHNYADVQLAYALPIGNYKASIGEITASDSYTPIINIYFLDASGQNVKTTVSLTSNQTKDFEIDASVAYILISFLGTQGTSTAAIRTVTFSNLMIRLATDASSDYEPYSMTNQELTPIAQAVSNRNLLDNPWFTVNQRGQSSYSGAADYSYDRWYRQQSGITVSLDSDDCIVIQNTDSSYSNFKQPFSAELIKAINGRTLTLSALFKDGTIQSATSQNIDLSQNASYCSIRLADGTNANIRSTNISNVSLQIAVKGNITIPAIRAFKLELGSVSTLAQDTAPNYAEELMKCRRYFERIGGSVFEQFASGFYANPSLFEGIGKCEPKREIPTITFNGTVYCWDYEHQGGSAFQSTALATGGRCSLDGRFYLPFTVSGATAGNAGFAQFRETTSYIDFSADL